MGNGGINAYNYAGNDPINSSDPTGRYTENDVNVVNKTMKTENKTLEDEYNKSLLELIFAIVFAVEGFLMALLIPGPSEFIESVPLDAFANVVFFTAVGVATTVGEKLIENGVMKQKGLKPSPSIGGMMSTTTFWEGVGIDAGAIAGGEIACLIIKGVARAIEGASSAARAGEAAAGELIGESAEASADESAEKLVGEPAGKSTEETTTGEDKINELPVFDLDEYRGQHGFEIIGEGSYLQYIVCLMILCLKKFQA